MITYLSTPPAPIWYRIPGYPDHEANLTTGQIRHRVTKRVLSQHPHYSGRVCYMYCSLDAVHRRLMEAAIGRQLRRDEYVRHRDGCGTNNALWNLEIGSPKDNSRDRVKHNTNGKTLRNADVQAIRRSAAEKKPVKAIARRYKVTVQHIRAILDGTRWANLPC